jgi:hypothetical protein
MASATPSTSRRQNAPRTSLNTAAASAADSAVAADFEGVPELQLFGQGGPEGGPGFDFRHFGPGVIVGGQGFGVAQMPNGVSISIQKENDQPAHITVKRGNETWEVVGDDPESLQQLPDDLRHSSSGCSTARTATFNIETPEFGPPPRPAFDGERIRERLKRWNANCKKCGALLGRTMRPTIMPTSTLNNYANAAKAQR